MAASEDIDLESIAAFIDGRLAGAERDRVVKLLGESEAAFEIYADAVCARADLGEGTVISMAAHRERRARRWWPAVPVAAAAAALLLVALPTMRSRPVGSELDMGAEVIVRPLTGASVGRPLVGQTDLQTALGPRWDERTWSVTRGASAALVDSTSALRLGVRATDLQVALATGDRDRAGRLAREIVEVLGTVRLSDASIAEFEAIQAGLANGDPLDQVVRTTAQADRNLNDFLSSRWFGLGKWFGAAELAARAHSGSFFSSRATAGFLESVIERERLAPEDLELLREVSVLTRRGVAGDEFESVRQKFAELIRRHGG
jgi:hypothetical protein